MRESARPGISTAALDRIAETVLHDHGAPPFPASIAASINRERVHGILSEKRIPREGDLISLDCSCAYQEFVGDSAFSMAVAGDDDLPRRIGMVQTTPLSRR